MTSAESKESKTLPPSPSSEPSPNKRKNRGAWRAEETQILPKNRLWIVTIGLMGCMFLAALDETIVTTALPTIVSQLGGGNNYSWVGSAYLLAAAAFSPLYGKLSDLIGRKPILYSSIAVFLTGSALCGAAQNIMWLIICRAVQGIGAGGIFQILDILVGDIVQLDRRGLFNGAISGVWGLANLLGPLVGGMLTDRVSWRWCFYINLPIGGISATILFFNLNLLPHQRHRSFAEDVQDFDFIGLGLMTVGVVTLLLGLNSSETAWNSVETITLLVAGVVLLVLAAVSECYTKRSPILPPRIFKTRTTAAVLICVFLHSITYFNGAYYLPLYFQILGASATGAGIRMLPFSLGGSITSAIGGIIVAKTKDYRITLWASWAIYCLGLGLMIMLDSYSNLAEKLLYTLVASIGYGPIFTVPLVALQAAMPLKDMATSTAAMVFVKIMGAAIGVAIGQTIFTSSLAKHLSVIPNLSISTESVSQLTENVKGLKDIPDTLERTRVIQGFAKSVSSIWIVMTPMAGAGLLISSLIRKYSLETVTSQGRGDTETGPEDDSTQGSGSVGLTPICVGDTVKHDHDPQADLSEVEETGRKVVA